MAAKRLPASRLAGIIAWTAASITWGTVAVALTNGTHATGSQTVDPPTGTPQTPVVAGPLAEAVPTMPTSGLVILRYTPVDRPEPRVVMRTVTIPQRSGTVGSASTPTREESSGS